MIYACSSPTIPAVAFDMNAFRAALKTQRKLRVGSRAKLVERCGAPAMSPTTIQNAELGPDMPGIDTVARLVEAMGLTLSTFFAQLERSQNQGLPLDASLLQDPAFPGAEADHVGVGKRGSVSAASKFSEAAAIVVGYLQDVAREHVNTTRGAGTPRSSAKAGARKSKRR